MFLDKESTLWGSLLRFKPAESLAHCCSLPKEPRNAEAGLLEQSSALPELRHQHSPWEVLRAAQSPGRDRAGVTLRNSRQASCRRHSRAHTALGFGTSPEPPALAPRAQGHAPELHTRQLLNATNTCQDPEWRRVFLACLRVIAGRRVENSLEVVRG